MIKISLWVRLLVIVTVALFAGTSLFLLIMGAYKAAMAVLLVVALMSPLLLEVIWPGRYVLRKPDGDAEDHLINRLWQFRADHPGWDGTLILGVFALLGIVVIAGALARLAQSFSIG